MATPEDRIATAEAKLKKLIGQRALEIEREEKARRAAIAASLDEWLGELPETERVKLFAGIEAKANTRNRKLIQRHPARPATMPEMPAETLN